MPAIVTKVISINLFFAQARRVTCEHCNEVFTYIDGGTETGQAEGVPLVSGNDGLAKKALKRSIKDVRKRAMKKKLGEARCPHCHQYQNWMIRKSRFNCIGCGSLLGFFLGFILVMILSEGLGWIGSDKAPIFALVAACLGVGLCGWFGYSLSLKPGADPEAAHPESKTDLELAEWIEECMKEEYDPFLAWYVGMDNSPPEKSIPVSLGLLDLVGGGVPDEFKTEVILEELKKQE